MNNDKIVKQQEQYVNICKQQEIVPHIGKAVMYDGKRCVTMELQAAHQFFYQDVSTNRAKHFSKQRAPTKGILMP